jgi:ketosteroid isomerase-like protein
VNSTLGIVFLCGIALVTGARGPNEANAGNEAVRPSNSMTIDTSRTKEEAAIRGMVDRFVAAIRAKDMNGVMSVFAPDVVSFDLGPPLQHGGGEPFRTRWQDLFESYQDGIDYEVRVEAGPLAASQAELGQSSPGPADRWRHACINPYEAQVFITSGATPRVLGCATSAMAVTEAKATRELPASSP